MDKLIPIKNTIIMKLVCKFFLKIFPLLTGEVEKREIISAFGCEIIGQKQQKDVRISFATVGPVAKLTSTLASIASQMVFEREISTPGVFPPEGCPDLNITKILKELDKRGIYILENAIHHY